MTPVRKACLYILAKNQYAANIYSTARDALNARAAAETVPPETIILNCSKTYDGGRAAEIACIH